MSSVVVQSSLPSHTVALHKQDHDSESEGATDAWVRAAHVMGGACTGGAMAMAAPMALGITSCASAVVALHSGVGLVRAFNSDVNGNRAMEAGVMIVAGSVACAASGLGAGLSLVGMPLTVPAACLGGALFNRTMPFSLTGSLVRNLTGGEGAGFGFGGGRRRSSKGTAPAMAMRAPAAVQQCAPIPAPAKMSGNMIATAAKLPSGPYYPAAAPAKSSTSMMPAQAMAPAKAASLPSQAEAPRATKVTWPEPASPPARAYNTAMATQQIPAKAPAKQLPDPFAPADVPRCKLPNL